MSRDLLKVSPLFSADPCGGRDPWREGPVRPSSFDFAQDEACAFSPSRVSHGAQRPWDPSRALALKIESGVNSPDPSR